MIPKISLRKLTAHVSGDDRAVQGVQAILPTGTFFLVFVGAAIVKPEGNVVRPGASHWYNDGESRGDKGYRVTKDQVWQFLHGKFTKVETPDIDPMLRQVIGGIQAGVLEPYATTQNPRPHPDFEGVKALIAPLPLPDQYALLDARNQIKALKQTLLTIHGDRENIPHPKRTKAQGKLLRYRQPNHNKVFVDAMQESIYLIGGMLANTFTLRWIYTPYAPRNYVKDLPLIIEKHLDTLMTIDARAYQLYAKYYDRYRAKMQDATPHPAELCLLRSALLKGDWDLLNHADVWGVSLPGRASFYLHQLDGFVADALGQKANTTIPRSLLYAVGAAMPEWLNHPYSKADLREWHTEARNQLIALGAKPMPPGTPDVPMDDTVPSIRPTIAAPKNPQKAFRNRARQYCLSDQDTRYRLVSLYQGVCNAIARDNQHKAQTCEIALGKLLVQLSATPELVICQPYIPGGITKQGANMVYDA
jgi:hypothetical protein